MSVTITTLTSFGLWILTTYITSYSTWIKSMRMSIKKATNLWRRVLKECYYTSDAARTFTVVGREFFPELLKEG